MKAVICKKYGSPEVLTIVDLPKPAPKANEILVKIKAFGITSGDSRIRAARFPKGFNIPARLALGFTGPRNKVLGSEFSGVVEEVGSAVTGFKSGDEVVGFKLYNVYAEFTVIKESAAIVQKPKKMSFEEAAGLPFGGSTALFFLNKGKLQKGESILINGASGAVGSAAIQIAKAMGAKVTAVCSTNNIDLVKSLGADRVIDYKTEEVFAEKANYDVILDTIGVMKFKEAEHNLNQNGRFLATVTSFAEMFTAGKKNEGKEFITGTAGETKEDLEFLVNLVNEGKLKTVVGKAFKFEDIVDAHKHVDSGHKVGSVVVKVG